MFVFVYYLHSLTYLDQREISMEHQSNMDQGIYCICFVYYLHSLADLDQREISMEHQFNVPTGIYCICLVSYLHSLYASSALHIGLY